MSGLFPVIIILVVLLILALMELPSATFSLFYHYALAKNTHKKADDLSLYYILGIEFFTASIWLLIYFIIYALFSQITDIKYNIIFWILAGICIAEAIIFFIFYFKKPKSKNSTELFISRHLATSIVNRIKTTKSRREAFLTGFFIGGPELLFTAPLYIIASIILTTTINLPSMLIIILSITLAVIPLFIMRAVYRSGQNLATIQRFRARQKPVLRIGVSLLYILLAFLIIIMELN